MRPINKRLCVLILIVAVFAISMILLSACDTQTAGDVQDGITFREVEDGYEVVSVDQTKDSYTVPVTYKDKPVVAIGNNAFYNAANIKQIVLPEGILRIGTFAFYGCKSIASITIPASVQEIGAPAFAFCTNLKSIEVASGNTVYMSKNNTIFDMDGKAIAGCSVSVLPNDGSVKAIGASAFRSCFLAAQSDSETAVTSFVIPSGVTAIGEAAFVCDVALQEISIPATVTQIDKFAFQGCVALKTIHFNGSKAQWEAIQKAEDYLLNVASCKVICTDGEISL